MTRDVIPSLLTENQNLRAQNKNLTEKLERLTEKVSFFEEKTDVPIDRFDSIRAARLAKLILDFRAEIMEECREEFEGRREPYDY